MFEGIIADLLVKHLGQYVKDLNKEKLKIGIWGGDVVLNNLELKAEALNSFNLPIEVKKGFIGNTTLKIPWKALKTQPVIVVLENIFLIASPNYSYTEYDGQKEYQKEQQLKKDKLANAELMKSFKVEGADDKSNDSFVSRLATKIVDNLQVVVNKIHLRLEDFTTNPEYPFAIGLCLDSLSVSSTDVNWKEVFVENKIDKLIYKLAKMENLSVYYNPITKITSLADIPTSDMSRVFSKMISVDKTNASKHHFFINPISAYLKLILNPSEVPDMAIPKVDVSVVFQDIDIELEEIQYHTLLKLVDAISAYERVKRFLKYRPSGRPKDVGGAVKWWKYATNAVLMDIRERNRRKSWKYLMERRKDRKVYVDLYKRKQKAKWQKPLTKEDIRILDELEEKLSFEDIIFFRSLAEAEFQQEAKNAQELAEFKKKQPKKGWFGGWFGGKSSSGEQEDEKPPLIQLTEEEKDELYRTIDYKDVMTSIIEPTDYIKIRSKIQITSGSLALHSSNKRERGPTLITAVVSTMDADVFIRPDSLKVQAGIKSFTMDDKITRDNQFPHMIARTDATQDLLKLTLEQNPLDKHADIAVDLAVTPLDVIINKSCLQRIGLFFAPPEDVQLDDIRAKAVESVNALSALTRAQLEDALQSHKTVDLKVDIQAPNVIIPQDPTSPKSPLLVLDLGHMNVKTDLSKITNKDNKETRAEEDFYDKFLISLRSMKVLLVPRHDQNWREAKLQKALSMQLVEEFDINIRVESCIQPTEVSLTKLKVSGNLPEFKINFSPHKYGQIMRLVQMLTEEPQQPKQIHDKVASLTTASAAVAIDPATMLLEQKKKEKQMEENQLIAQRKLVDVTFKIPRIAIVVNNSTNLKESNLVTLFINGLDVYFIQRPFDMHARLVLHSIKMEDGLQPADSKFKNLITSALPLEESSYDSDLIKIEYQMITKESPSYNGIESVASVYFNTLSIMCNRETISALIEFGLNDILKEQQQLQRQIAATSVSTEQKPSLDTHAPSHMKAKPKSDIKMKISADVRNISILLNRDGEELSEFSIRDIAAGLTMWEHTMQVKGRLGDVQIKNLKPVKGGEHHEKILTILRDEEKQAMLQFTYVTFSQLEHGYPGYDASVSAEMRSIQFIFLNAFLMEIQSYFLDGPIMASLAKSTAAMAIESAKAGAEIAAESTTKMKLQATVLSPVIVVPRSSTSRELMVIELGKLTLSNNHQQYENNGVQALVEHMDVNVTSMNIKTLLQHSADESFIELSLLQDVNTKVSLARLVDLQHKNHFPQLKLRIDVSSVQFLLAQKQLEFVMYLLNENLKEAPQKSPQNSFENLDAPSTTVKASASDSSKPVARDEAGNVAIDIAVVVAQVNMKTLYGYGNEGIPPRSVATFCIGTITTQFKQFGDSSMQVGVAVQSMILEDTRQNRKSAFSCILQSNLEEGQRDKPQITLDYKAANQEQRVSIYLNNPCINVVPDAVYELKDFFMSALPPSEPPKQVGNVQKQNLESDLPQQAPVNLFAEVFIVEPEILLLHDPTREDTKAVVVKSSFEVKYSKEVITEEGENISEDTTIQFSEKAQVSVIAFQAFVSEARKRKQEDSLPIIKPFNIDLTYTNAMLAQQVLISIQSISMLFSYQDFKLTMAILNALQPPAAPAPQQQLQPNEQLPVQPVTAPEVPKVVRRGSEKLALNCPCILFTLINDYEGRNIRLAEFRLADIAVTALNWSANLSSEVWFGVSGDYFNDNIVQFEPLIEYWPCYIRANKMNNPKFTVEISSKEKMNINVSHAFINTLGAIMEILNKDYYAKEPLRLDNTEAYSPYWLINDSGSSVTIWTEESTFSVAYRERRPITFTRQNKNAKLETNQSRSVTLKIEGHDTKIAGVSLDTVGCTIQMSQESISSNQLPIVCEVELLNGSKVLTIRSLTVITNDTTVPIEVGIFLAESEPVRIIGPIVSLSSISLPLEYAAKGSIGIRPAGELQAQFAFSAKSQLSVPDLRKAKEEQYGHSFYCPSVVESQTFSFCATSWIEKKHISGKQQTTLHLTPPIRVENLLPCGIRFQLVQEKQTHELVKLDKGEAAPFYYVDPKRDIRMALAGVPGYNESAPHLVHSQSSSVSETLELRDLKDKALKLHLDNRMEDATRAVSIYSAYWILNNADIPIFYRQSSFGPEEGNLLATKERRIVASTEEDPDVPTMFSFQSGTLGITAKMVAKVEDSKWSKAFNVDTAGTNGIIQMEDKKRKFTHELGVSLYLGKYPFERTKIIEFCPRMVIVNETGKTVTLRQAANKNEITVAADSRKAFPGWAEDAPKQVSLTFQEEEWEWSAGFVITDLADFKVKVPKSNSHESYLVGIEVKQDYATTMVYIKKEDKKKPPYRLDNRTSYEFKYMQKDSGLPETLPAFQSVPFTWDQPSKPRYLVLSLQGTKFVKEIPLDVIDSFEPFQLRNKGLYISVEGEESTRVLYIRDEKPLDNVEELVDIEAKILFKGFGLSVVDSTPKELTFISVNMLKMTYSQSNLDQKVHIVLGNFQIDNQLENTHLPVLLSYVQKDPKKPFFEASLVKSTENTSIDYFSYFSVLLQEMSLKVDDQFLNTMLKFYSDLNLEPITKGTSGPPTPTDPPRVTIIADPESADEKSSLFVAGTYYFCYTFYPGKMSPLAKVKAYTPFSAVSFTKLQTTKGFTRVFYIAGEDKEKFYQIDALQYRPGTTDDLTPTLTTNCKDYSKTQPVPYTGEGNQVIEKPQATEAKKMYFKIFMLNPIKVNLTFNMTPADSDVEKKSSHNPLRIVTQLLGTTIANIDNAPIGLNALMLEDAFGSSAELVSRITQHYTRQGIQEVYKILGSADFLGNPVGLFNSIGTGFKDFFYEPAQGLIESPEAFGKGLAKGTLSLVKNSVYGTFNTVSKLSGTVGKGIATLSLDPEYIQKRQAKQVLEKPKHFGEGVLYGMKDLGVGIFEGISGLVVQPVKGASQEGAVGFFKGLGRGFIGVGIKPVVGAIDLVSKTTEGIRNTTTLGDKNVERSRLPRAIGPDKILFNYTDKEAEGVWLLNHVDDGTYKSETYFYHDELEDDQALLITNQRVIMINLKTFLSNWTVELQYITLVNLTEMGLLIQFSHEPEYGIIPTTSSDQSMVLYTKIGAAVKSCKKSQAMRKRSETKR